MRKLLLCCLGFAILAGCAASGQVLEGHSYMDDAYSFSVSFPQNYRLTPGGKNSKDRLVASKQTVVEGRSLQPSFLLSVYPKDESGSRNVQEFAKDHFAKFVFELLENQSERETQVAQHHALLIFYTTRRTTGETWRKKGVNVYIDAGAYYLVVAYVSGVANYSEPEFTQVLKTIEIN